MELRAALYIRLSREDDSDGPSQSVQNQKAMLLEFVRQRDIRSYEIYADDGYSGTNFDRPGFQRMIRDIEAGKVNLVITKDLSRLGRDYILTGHYMERYFPEHRVRYISLLDGIDTGVDSGANDITPFRAILNDLYAKDISKKIKSVKRAKQRQGLFIGGKPVYGYQMHPTEKNRIVIDPAAAPTVQRIFALALSGQSCSGIARQLNSEQIPPPAVYAGLAQAARSSGLWSGERIREMLRNETYIGSMVQGRQVKISYKSKKCLKQPKEDWVVVAGTHTPLIDENTFRKVGEILDSRRHTRSRRYDFLLKGLVFCHECGAPLGVLNRKNAAGEDVLYLVCRGYQRGNCTAHTVKEQTVTQAVLRQVRPLWQAHRALLTALAEQTASRDLPGEIAGLTARLDRMYRDVLSGLLPEEDFQRLAAPIFARRRELQARQEEERPGKKREAGLVRGFLDSGWQERAAIVSLIRRVELTQDRRILVYFRFRLP